MKSGNFSDVLHHVTVHKDASGLGLTLVGGRDTSPTRTHCVPRISGVIPGGAADRTGRLLEGDVLVRVDGEDVTEFTHQVHL